MCYTCGMKRFRKHVTTKTGKKIILRGPRKSDVDGLLYYINALVDEDTFISVVEKVTREQEEKYVNKLLKSAKENNIVCVLAEYQGTIISNSSIERVGGRQAHVGVFGIAISKGFRNEGLGSIVIEELIKLAKEQMKLKIVYLPMFAHNERARYVYEKMGFAECGRIPKAVLHQNQYVDYVYMYREL